jgi:hypothetical protein
VLVEHVQDDWSLSPDLNRPSVADRAMVGLAVVWAAPVAVVVAWTLTFDWGMGPSTRMWIIWGICLAFAVVAAVPLAMPTTRSLRVASWSAAGLILVSPCVASFLAIPFLPGILPLMCAGTPCPRVKPPLAHLSLAAVLGSILLWFIHVS